MVTIFTVLCEYKADDARSFYNTKLLGISGVVMMTNTPMDEAEQLYG